MSELILRIDKYLEMEDPTPPEVFVKIYQIDKDTGKTIRSLTEETVPITHDAAYKKHVSLDPGHYYVESVLPSGEVVSGSAWVKANENTELTLQTRPSPHEWLGWQQLTGNLPRKGKTRKRSYKKGIAADSTIDLLRRLQMPATELRGGAEVWKFLANLKAGTAEKLCTALNGGQTSESFSPYNHDENRAVYRIRSGDFPQPPGGRWYAAAMRTRSVELIVLPLPWDVVNSGRPASIEIGIDRTAKRNEFSSTAGVLDERFGILVGYLTTGALPEASKIAKQAKELLYSKVQNPLAAAAGGYALVASASKTSEQEWHSWVNHLNQNYPNIPDGAIQWAQLRWRLRSTPKDLEDAAISFKSAFNRGLPYYSMGIRWLLEGLDWFSPRDTEAAAMSNLVRKVSWLTNFVQPFTMIKLGDQ
jgi:hypothetical protein